MPPPALHRLRKDEIIWMATHRCGHRHTFLEHPQCYTPHKERIGFFDIETSNLAADFGVLLTYCIKPMWSKAIITGQIQSRDIAKARAGDEDKVVVAQCISDLFQFDRIVTFYGKRFDVPFVRTRALSTGLDFPSFGTLKHTDLYDVIRHRFRLSSNRLENACRVLLGHTNKTRIEAKYWRAGARGDEVSLAHIVEHNKYDVVDLEALYLKTIDFARKQDCSI